MISKRFVIVDHSIPLMKLSHYGIHGKAYMIFYQATYRKQCSICLYLYTLIIPTLTIYMSPPSVSQGSVLGTCCFLSMEMILREPPSCFNMSICLDKDCTKLFNQVNCTLSQLKLRLANLLYMLANTNYTIFHASIITTMLAM